MTINVIDTLQTDNFGVELVSSDYVGYYEYKTTRFPEDAEETYTNTLLLEILNNTDDNNEYNVVYGSEVGIRFYGNIESIPDYTVENGNVLSVGSNGEFSYVITTSENGKALITFTVRGNKVDDNLSLNEDVTVNYYIEAKSYSLLDEFYLMNEGRYAVDNIVYYGQSGTLPTESTSVSFDVYAENQEAFGFYKYKISDSFIEDIKAGIATDNGLSPSNIIAQFQRKQT